MDGNLNTSAEELLQKIGIQAITIDQLRRENSSLRGQLDALGQRLGALEAENAERNRDPEPPNPDEGPIEDPNLTPGEAPQPIRPNRAARRRKSPSAPA